MDFSGIGPFELLVILILGFLFFGPEKLPGMANKAGRIYRKLRKAGTDFSRSLTEDISAQKGKDSDLQEDNRNFRNDLNDLRKSIMDDITSEKSPPPRQDVIPDSSEKGMHNTSSQPQERISNSTREKEMKENSTGTPQVKPDRDANERG